jgi:rhodanese-related sulfurtransferase
MSVRRIDVPQAKAALEGGGAVYLDVRTEEEFAQGHPEGAINIPIGTPNPATRALDPNPQFVAVAKGVLEPTTPILVGCRTGPRAEAAARLLEQAGYQDVAWVHGGYVGITDPAGRPVARGWLELQYPTSTSAGENVGYASLRRKAGV